MNYFFQQFDQVNFIQIMYMVQFLKFVATICLLSSALKVKQEIGRISANWFDLHIDYYNSLLKINTTQCEH